MSNWDTSTGQVSRVPVHQCDHTNCIPRSELPGLPEHWSVGFTGRELKQIRLSMSKQEWDFLATVLNTCYPAPTATKEG